MWIRSQDEKHLLKVEHLYITTTTLNNLFKEKDEDLTYDIRTSSVALGQYSTKEKALKVLDMIEKHNNNGGRVFCVDQIKTGIGYCATYEKVLNVFQMPKDEDVK